MPSNRNILALTLIFASTAPVVMAQATPKKLVPKPAATAAAAPLTNDDVMGLASVGLGDDVIIAKIRTAPATNFDTSVAGLKALKAGGVSTAVIRVMIDPSQPAPVAVAAAAPVAAAPAAPAAADPDDPNGVHAPGIYMLAPGADGVTHLFKLEHIVPKQSHTSGTFLSGISYGIAKAHVKVVLDGMRASNETTAPQATFYAYIPEDNTSFGGSTITIKDFALIKFDVKGNTREVNTASASMWGASEGTDAKARQGFTSESVKPGIYKLTLTQVLPPGEYAFQQSGGQGTANGQNTGAYFDFGVLPPK